MVYLTEIGKDLDRAATLLSGGDLVAVPTETVYGLAANAFNENAVNKIFEVKRRPTNNPLIVHLHAAEQLAGLVNEVPELSLKLIDAFSPGPLTVILKKTSSISDLVTAGQGTVAIRIPDNKMTLDLLRMVQFPLAAPSANVFMRLSPTKPSHVYAQLSDAIPYILDGGSCSRGIESTIVGVEQNKIIIYRHGAITKTQLTTMGVEIVEYTGMDGILTPGRFKKHYSPRTKLVLAKNINVAIERYAHQVTGVLNFGSTILPTASFVVRNLSIREDIDEAAFELYNSLYELDEMGLDAILCTYVPNRGVGIGINERLLKAATIIID